MGHQRSNDRHAQQAQHTRERSGRRQQVSAVAVAPEVFGQHLHAHKDQNGRQPIIQIAEQIHHAGQQKVKRPQPQNGEHIRGKHNEGEVIGPVIDHAENGRHAVEGEHHVGGFYHQQHHEQRRHAPAAQLTHEETIDRIALRHGNPAAHEPQQGVFVRMRACLAVEAEPCAGVNQKRPE